MLVGIAGGAGEQPRVRSLVMQDETILRVPVRPQQQKFDWVEHEGPKCINVRAIRGAFLSGPDSVDLITVRGRRIRAELDDDCPALDYYGGFYLKPEDTRLCAGRDLVRSRMGGNCMIDSFKLLTAKPKG